MSFEELFSHIRLDEVGSEYFSGEVGDYALKRFSKLRAIIDSGMCKLNGDMRGCENCKYKFDCWTKREDVGSNSASVSKRIGWER